MNGKRIIVIAIALFCAVAAFIGLYGFMNTKPKIKYVNKPTVKKQHTVEVLVAAKDLKFGDKLGKEDFKWHTWPKEAITPNYISRNSKTSSKSAEYEGAIVRSGFLKGEPLRVQKIVKAGEGGVMAAILTPGMRAVSVRIKENTAAGNFILPNDRVDVLVTKSKQGEKERVTYTILSNVRVLAIGQAIEEVKGKKTVVGKTATVELTLGQSESLAAAESSGSISLALRSLQKGKVKSDANENSPVTINSFGETGRVQLVRP